MLGVGWGFLLKHLCGKYKILVFSAPINILNCLGYLPQSCYLADRFTFVLCANFVFLASKLVPC